MKSEVEVMNNHITEQNVSLLGLYHVDNQFVFYLCLYFFGETKYQGTLISSYSGSSFTFRSAEDMVKRMHDAISYDEIPRTGDETSQKMYWIDQPGKLMTIHVLHYQNNEMWGYVQDTKGRERQSFESEQILMEIIEKEMDDFIVNAGRARS